MLGIETFEILIFLRQLGIAVAGAVSFWGTIFLLLSKGSPDKRSSALWQGISQKILWLFFPAALLYGIIWAAIAISQCVFCIDAHEGIAIAETSARLSYVVSSQYGLYTAFMTFAAVGFLIFLFRRNFLYEHLLWLYGISFVIISVFLLYPWAPLESPWHNISAALHGWHSIFTLGSVILVDFLFIALKSNLRPYLSKIFPIITLGIWVGLGLDFINAGIVFREEFFPTARILFMQTLVGIIIINGVLLSGPLARKVLAYQTRMRNESLPPKLSNLLGLSGSISLGGWFSITALDGFRALTFSYWQLWASYILFVITIFLCRAVFEKVAERH
ncbi:MAG: hypothetical protein WAP23_02865 [Candidatus Spechtbacterales bacterium]